MEETLQRFRAWLEAQDRSPRTVQAYLSDLAHFARWFAQTNDRPFTPEAVTPTDVLEYRQWMVAVQGLTPATVNRRIAALRTFSAWAYKAGLIASDPTEGIRLLSEQPQSPRWLDRRQQAALRRALERRLEHAELKARLARLEGRPVPPEWVWARRDAALVHLMLNAGLRVGEVVGLAMKDVALRERTGQVVVRQGKGNRRRAVPLNGEARAALQAWLEARPTVETEAVFVGRRGRGYDGIAPLRARAVQRMVARLGEAAGIEGLTPHVLRHTFAKNLMDAGVGLQMVAELLGHRRLETTRIYTRPGERDLERAVEAIGVG